jgi:hypothetical protein
MDPRIIQILKSKEGMQSIKRLKLLAKEMAVPQ